MAYNNVASQMESSDTLLWPEATDLWSNDIEEVVRQQTPQFRAAYRHAHGPELPRLERSVRRRLRAEEIRVKSHQTFTITAMPNIRLRTGADHSELSSSCSPVTVVTSATSSAGTPWSTSGRFEEVYEDEGAYAWEIENRYQHQDDYLIVPKLEPSEELEMEELYDVEGTSMQRPPAQKTSLEVPAKRGRGRPRKHPKQSPENMAKVNKGRSKTGCGTCRKRKKKCDEAKPICNNCVKNNVECCGYRELQHWKSGKEKKEEEERKKRRDMEDIKRTDCMIEVRGFSMPSLFPGVVNELDRIFFKHYADRLSVIFTVEDELNSSFRRLVLPYALNDKGLMHSLLSLASQHIDYTSSYGRQILMEHPNVNRFELEQRSNFHLEEAQRALQKRGTDTSLGALHLQVICQILSTLNEENPKGDHRLHLKYSQQLPPCDDEELRPFLEQFYRYHIFTDQIISLPQPGHAYHNFHAEWNLPTTILQKGAVPLLGVSDTLLLYMSRITNLRNQIRADVKAGNEPAIGFPALNEAFDIDSGIRSWAPVWPEGDYRDPAGQVYQCMMSVYLFRTISPTLRNHGWEVDSRITEAVNIGIDCLSSLGPRSKLQTVLLAPTFVIGCGAFEPEQRDKIRKIIKVIKAYMEYKNTDTALRVLEEVWRLMDLKDERSWDWQTIAHDMGIDFLAT